MKRKILSLILVFAMTVSLLTFFLFQAFLPHSRNFQSPFRSAGQGNPKEISTARRHRLQ